MALPVVTIVGRPNVGKSSLLNVISGKMISIVEPTAGVTRDRVSAIVDVDDRFFELIDTGGYGIVDVEDLTGHVEHQIHLAIEASDVVLFVVDIRDGIMPLDVEMARKLRKADLNVILVANKADTATLMGGGGEFVRLGFGDPVCVSAANIVNKAVLLEKVIEAIEHLPHETPEKAAMKIAIVGKRNAGKSTFVNSIVGEDRVIASEVAGTTRDAVDVHFERDGQKFLVIDTAGVRKKSKMSSDIEYYGYTRALRSINRADVVLFMLDATSKIAQADKKLAHSICDEYKACIIVVNKWDLAVDFADTDDYADYITEMLPALRFTPIAFTTATDGKNIQSVLDLATEIYKQASADIPTALINKSIEKINLRRIPGTKKKRGMPRILYGTQVAKLPISILLFVNHPHLFDDNYMRYATNQFRDMIGIEEVPIRLMLRARGGDRSKR
ncbi:MAG: ribosome biogenesis GTPase Der [Planctomycetes bacterium]|nr:ribosome biogenesis GTPase Der [Planctomycetota bacterium]